MVDAIGPGGSTNTCALEPSNIPTFATYPSTPVILRKHASYHDCRALSRLERTTEGMDYPFPSSLFRTEVHEENLIFTMMDFLGQLSLETNPLAIVQVTAKDGELKMFAMSVHELEDVAKARGVADVVCDQINGPHGLPREEGGILGNLTDQEPPQ